MSVDGEGSFDWAAPDEQVRALLAPVTVAAGLPAVRGRKPTLRPLKTALRAPVERACVERATRPAACPALLGSWIGSMVAYYRPGSPAATAMVGSYLSPGGSGQSCPKSWISVAVGGYLGRGYATVASCAASP